MSKLLLGIVGAVVVVSGIVASSALFTVDETVQAIVMQFGDPKRVVSEPGLHVKTPFVQNVVYYDNRILDLDPPTAEIILADQKRINVDSFARYRISDPLRFFQSVRTEAGFRDQFGGILNSSVRNVLGLKGLPDLLSERREDIMVKIKEIVVTAGKTFGVEVVDVRIGRTDLPADISKNVFDRMRSEREREANLLRAEGDEAKQRLTADADRQKVFILAKAQKQAEILRGEGEGVRTKILNDAYGKDIEFFSLYRSLEAYEGAFGDGTTMVLSPDSEFFRYFGSVTGEAKQ
jgi:membrane protease subunit HflC